MTEKKERIYYHIFCGPESLTMKLFLSGFDTHARSFMRIDSQSEIGKLIHKEAEKRIERLK